MMNNTGSRWMFWREVAFHDGLVFAVLHVVASDYLCMRDTLPEIFCPMCLEVLFIETIDLAFGLAGVFGFIKSYHSWLVAEVSQLCYRGGVRRMSLGSTDGLSCW